LWDGFQPPTDLPDSMISDYCIKLPTSTHVNHVTFLELPQISQYQNPILSQRPGSERCPSPGESSFARALELELEEAELETFEALTLLPPAVEDDEDDDLEEVAGRSRTEPSGV